MVKDMLTVGYYGAAVETRHVPQPELHAGEVLLKPLLVGICKTDLEICKGYMGYTGTLGHEFVAEVLEVQGQQQHPLVGQRVVGDINCKPEGCEQCFSPGSCARRHCPGRTVLGILGRPGCMAERFTLPLENLHIVPDTVSNVAAVFAEPIAAACEILEQIPNLNSAKVAIIGDGRLAQICALVLRGRTKTLQIFGKYRDKLQRCAHLGIPLGFSAELLAQAFDVVFEATGSPTGLDHAVNAVRPRGTVVLKSTYAGNLSFNFAQLVIQEITLVGSRCGRTELALDLLKEGQVDPTYLIDARLPLRDAAEGFKLAQQTDCLKVLLHP